MTSCAASARILRVEAQADVAPALGLTEWGLGRISPRRNHGPKFQSSGTLG